MASTNLLQVKSHLTEFKGNSEKDTLSEASESGTSNSVTSAEDIQKLAVILGLSSAEDVHQERFRVDRRRLEAMLAENLEESQTAQAFFHRVMTDTNTLINWPARLKIGARSKKDPHVRVAGRPDDVRLAREKIMQLLDTRNNRVTMKIDVSYTDHSHIIGKGGLTIKRVMEETGCHIHFPDSNRTSAVEKSNQVSIAGDMERVERARARVRALTPLVFSFELPIVAQPLPDLTSPYVQQIQEQYKVQVMLRNRPKLHANLMVVKGVQWEVRATMEATTLLMQYMCGPIASQTQVQMSLEISPMHHTVVVGRGAEQLKMIMQGTNTQIMFPDAEDPNIPVIRKSCVTITGQIKDVYAARQQLVGSLPLVVIFDVSEESCRIESDTAANLMQKYNVYVNIRRKPKQGIASIVIKGIERCAGDIYEVRREILGNSEPVINAEIPESYNIPAISGLIHSFGAFNPFSPSHAANIASMNSPRSPYIADLGQYANMGSPMFGHNPPTPGGFPSPVSPVTMTPPVWLIPSPQPRAGQFTFPTNLAVPNHNSVMYKNQGGAWNPLAGPELGSPQMMQYQHMPQDGRLTTLQQILNSSSAGSSGYQSNFTGSSVSLDVQNTSGEGRPGNWYGGGENGSSVASPSVSPISAAHTHSPAHSTDTDRSQQEIASIVQEVPLSERRAPGCEKKTLETLKMSPPVEYHKLKAEAGKEKCERRGVNTDFITPDDIYALLRISQNYWSDVDKLDQTGSTSLFFSPVDARARGRGVPRADVALVRVLLQPHLAGARQLGEHRRDDHAEARLEPVGAGPAQHRAELPAAGRRAARARVPLPAAVRAAAAPLAAQVHRSIQAARGRPGHVRVPQRRRPRRARDPGLRRAQEDVAYHRRAPKTSAIAEGFRDPERGTEAAQLAAVRRGGARAGQLVTR